MNSRSDQWKRPERGQRAAIVASHRRSGTHLLLEYITRELGIGAGKSHGFAERQPDTALVYAVRNPIETLWSTYRWFAHGASGNTRIAGALQGLSFDDFIRGAGAARIGFDAMRDPDTPEALLDSRGMFYSPCRFWADHVRSYLALGEDALVLRYEDLLTDPAPQIARVAAHVGATMPPEFTVITREELVGHAPSPKAPVPVIGQWSSGALEVLTREAGGVLATMGYLPSTSTPQRRRPVVRHSMRYISRVNDSGISVAGRRCFGALVAAGADVVWEPEPRRPGTGRRVPPDTAPELLRDHYRPNVQAECTVFHTAPEHWSSLRTEFTHGTFVGHTVWELERVPAAWRGALHVVDELWMPTQWNRDVFVGGEIRRPIHVVPHVITTDEVADPPIDIPDDVTVFTTISAWHPRKRPDRAIEAFAAAFTKDDPVILIVKTPSWVEAYPSANELEKMTWYRMATLMKRFPDAPPVLLVNDDFTDAQINGLLRRTDCYVSLASTEGWGLGQFDAATFGKPVITTAFGGHLEYFGVNYPGLVPFEWESVGETANSPHLEPTMRWASPSLEVAADMMRAIVDGTSSILPATGSVAKRLQHDYSPLAVGQLIVSMMEAGK